MGPGLVAVVVEEGEDPPPAVAFRPGHRGVGAPAHVRCGRDDRAVVDAGPAAPGGALRSGRPEARLSRSTRFFRPGSRARGRAGPAPCGGPRRRRGPDDDRAHRGHEHLVAELRRRRRRLRGPETTTFRW
jgi:hypothetical protein